MSSTVGDVRAVYRITEAERARRVFSSEIIEGGRLELRATENATLKSSCVILRRKDHWTSAEYRFRNITRTRNPLGLQGQLHP